jgi:hypothetical protein
MKLSLFFSTRIPSTLARHSYITGLSNNSLGIRRFSFASGEDLEGCDAGGEGRDRARKWLPQKPIRIPNIKERVRREMVFGLGNIIWGYITLWYKLLSPPFRLYQR